VGLDSANYKNGELVDEKYFIGCDAADKCVDYLLEIEKAWIRSYLNSSIDVDNLTKREVLNYDRATECYMCQKMFTSLDWKVRDRDHSDGPFLGAAHNSCNLRRRRQKKVNIYVHNEETYDFHFNEKALFKKKLDVDILPHNNEKI